MATSLIQKIVKHLAERKEKLALRMPSAVQTSRKIVTLRVAIAQLVTKRS